MTSIPIHKSDAFTRLELVVVIAVVFVTLWMVVSTANRGNRDPSRTSCVHHLKQIGLAYAIWANDHNGRFPASESMANGGWMDALTNFDQGSLCWTNYEIMANELGMGAKLLECPSDERKAAAVLQGRPPMEDKGTNVGFTDNRALSYFVGVSADQKHPQSLLAGDRNLGRGIQPDHDYGFSPRSDAGNDVVIQTNSKADPVCWSLKMHSQGNPQGRGNILLSDGSAQAITTPGFGKNWQPLAGQTTNWPVGHIPSSPSFRLLFP